VPRDADQGAALQALGRVIRELRDAKGKTQAAIAEATGLTEQYIRKIERGKGNPSYLALQRIAAALGLDLQRLAVLVRADRDAEGGPGPRDGK